MRPPTSRKRLIILLVCAVVVVGAGLGIGWATLGGNEPAPQCAKTAEVHGKADLDGAVDCLAKVSKWCHDHHPGDESPCMDAVTDDGDDQNIGKYKTAAREAKPAPSATSTMTPLQQAFEKNRKALYDWYSLGIDSIGIEITKMEMKPDGYVYITFNLPSNYKNEGKMIAMYDFSDLHQDDFQTTLKHMTELKGTKGVKTFYLDGKPVTKPHLTSPNEGNDDPFDY
ncbi:hypothetical protein [Streptomyces sp. DSM 118148]|uniref:hypothetical protein n=1 Tax=Streptomyces sp. DSM 118148 TaxID=3448667 RepID=UPI004040253B